MGDLDIRPADPDDREAIKGFLSMLSMEDQTFMKEDVKQPTIIDRWLSTDPPLLLAVDEDERLVGMSLIVRGIGRSRHVAEIRLVVGHASRRQGVGRELARRSLASAVTAGCRKVTVEVAATQSGTIGLFRGLGFIPEALLRDHLRDGEGNMHDLIVLSHLVDENWQRLFAPDEAGS